MMRKKQPVVLAVCFNGNPKTNNYETNELKHPSKHYSYTAVHHRVLHLVFLFIISSCKSWAHEDNAT